MSVLILIVFSAVFAIGQSTWQQYAWNAKRSQEAEDLHKAESSGREALRLAEQELGSNDKQLAALLSALSFTLHFERRDAEAEPLMQRAVVIARQSGDQCLTGLMLNVLGVVLSGEGQQGRAEPVLRRSVAILEEADGVNPLDLARSVNNLATVYLDTQQYERAEQEMARALPVYQRYLPPDASEMAQVFGNMYTVMAFQHRAVEGEPYLRRALTIGEKNFPGTLKMANLQLCLASLEAERNHFRTAAELVEQVIGTEEKLLGAENPEVAKALRAYAVLLHHLHQDSKAKSVQKRADFILKSAVTQY